MSGRARVLLVVVLGLVASAGLLPAEGEPRRVTLHAKKFEWTPSTFTVRVGEPVEITLESDEGTHGFYCKELGTDRVTFRSGEPVTIRVTPQRAGTYSFQCSRYCGQGHSRMKGTVVVTP